MRFYRQYKMANVLLWISIVILIISNEAKATSLFNWFWGTATDDTSVLVADGVPLISIPYETMTEDEKFLKEAAKFTNIQVASPLETCQHKVIMKIRTSCTDITEEQLAKLSVNLLNCQAAVEGRKLFPCTDEMSLKQCTTDMDADMWNAYHLISNRARAVCYAARSTQFRALTELTVNKLMETAHVQIKTLISLKENQDHIMDQTNEVLSSLTEGNKALLQQQEYLKDAQTSAHKLVITNLRDLSNEKAMIRLGHAQLANMVEDVKEKLEKANQELIEQSTVRSESHKEILNDLMNIQNKAQLIWNKVESSTSLMFEQHEQATSQYEQIMKKLAHINGTIQFITNTTNRMRTEIEQTIRQLDWITDYIGDTEEQFQKLYRIALHIMYLLIAMITAAFLSAPFWTRAAIMGIIPLNLVSYLKHGLEACLDFTSITALIFLITGMHFLMNGIQYLCNHRFKDSEPVKLINQNGLSSNGTRIYTSSPNSKVTQRAPMLSTIIKILHDSYEAALHKINSFTGLFLLPNLLLVIIVFLFARKTSKLIQSIASWNPQNLSVREQLSCSYVAAKKSREDVYNYDYPDMTDDVLSQDMSDQYSNRNNISDSRNLVDMSDLRNRLKVTNDTTPTYLEQTNQSRSSSRSVTPMHVAPRMLCNGLTRTGRRCRLFAIVGREFCSRHSTGTSVIND